MLTFPEPFKDATPKKNAVSRAWGLPFTKINPCQKNEASAVPGARSKNNPSAIASARFADVPWSGTVLLGGFSRWICCPLIFGEVIYPTTNKNSSFGIFFRETNCLFWFWIWQVHVNLSPKLTKSEVCQMQVDEWD